VVGIANGPSGQRLHGDDSLSDIFMVWLKAALGAEVAPRPVAASSRRARFWPHRGDGAPLTARPEQRHPWFEPRFVIKTGRSALPSRRAGSRCPSGLSGVSVWPRRSSSSGRPIESGEEGGTSERSSPLTDVGAAESRAVSSSWGPRCPPGRRRRRSGRRQGCRPAPRRPEWFENATRGVVGRRRPEASDPRGELHAGNGEKLQNLD
jgi:hypothetical protein